MKAGAKTYLLWGIGGAFFLLNLAELLSGQGDLIDIPEAIFFLVLSAEGFVSDRWDDDLNEASLKIL